MDYVLVGVPSLVVVVGLAYAGLQMRRRETVLAPVAQVVDPAPELGPIVPVRPVPPPAERIIPAVLQSIVGKKPVRVEDGTVAYPDNKGRYTGRRARKVRTSAFGETVYLQCGHPNNRPFPRAVSTLQP